MKNNIPPDPKPPRKRDGHDKRLAKGREDVLTALGRLGPSSLGTIAECAGYSKDTVQSRLEELLAQGLVSREKQVLRRGPKVFIYRRTDVSAP